MEIDPKNAYLITVDSDIEQIYPQNGSEFNLKEVQQKVEGYIEIVYLNDEQIMIVNEEGKFSKRFNAIATGIAELNHSLFAGDYICGNVVICPSAMLP